MQKLYKVAFQRILTKVGAGKVDNLSVESLGNLLKEKNIPLNEIDQTIFHKIPREELKNLMRNPCPITKAEQTSTEAVTAAKAVRGALNIVEKRICFKCPFVGTCDKAFLEPPSDFKIQNPLQNLLITMKNTTQLQNSEIYKPRSWISGVRVCDSMNSVLDDLAQGGEEFKIFKQERIALIDQPEAENEKEGKANEKQLIKQAKKQKVPLKDVYAQIPSSNKPQDNAEKQGEEAFEQLSKGPENIFKKKKSNQFIKIAQKYLNEQKIQKDKNFKEQRKQKKGERKNRTYEENDDKQQQFQQQRGVNRRQMRSEQRGERYGKGKYNNNPRQQTNYRQQRNYRQQQNNNRRFDNNRENSKRQNYRENYRDQNNEYNSESYQQRIRARNGTYQMERNNDNQRGGYQQKHKQRDYNQEEEANPRIRRFSKDNQGQYKNYQQSQEQTGASRKNKKLDKFFTEMKEQRSDEEEILSNFNRKQPQRETTRLPRDAREKPQGGRGSSMEFGEKEMREFDRLQKVPKILKTQFASKQDIQQRQQQQFSQEETSSERKGRRVKRN